MHGVKKKPQKKIWDQVLGWKWLNPFNIAIVCFCFDNFFDSFTSILKLYDRSVYSFGTAWKARKGMPEMLIVKIMKLYSGKVAWCKWFERRLGSILFSNVEELIITSTVSCQQEGPSSKILVPQPDIIKICNKGMDGVEVIYQRTVVYHLDRKSTIRFCLHIFFDLMDVIVCSNSYIIYNMMHPNGLTLIDFKTIVSTYLIGRYTSRSRAPPDDKTGYNKRY